MSVFVTVSIKCVSQRGLGSHRPHGTRAGLMNEPWKKTKKNIFILKVFRSLRTFTSFTTLPSTVLPSTSILLSFVSPFLPPSAWCWKFPHHYHFIPLSTLHFTSFPHLRHSFCFNFQLSLPSIPQQWQITVCFPRILENSVMCLYQAWQGLDIIYEGKSSENLKSAIKIRNTARLSCKSTTAILMVRRVADRWQHDAGMRHDGAVVV